MTVQPTFEPVTTQDAKDWCRISNNSDDVIVGALIKAARQYTENVTSRLLLTQTVQLTLDEFPACIHIERTPIQSVTLLQYVDGTGTLQTLDPSVYQVDLNSDPVRIMPAYGEVWPTTRSQLAAVKVTFVAGYGSQPSDVPLPIRQAILLLVASMYDQRSETSDGKEVKTVPFGFTALTSSFRAVYI